MANRVLSTTERQACSQSALFKEQCQWATRNYAAYWAIAPGTNLLTEAAAIKWAKDRQLGVAIDLNDIGDQDIALKFVKLGKGIQVDLPSEDQPVEAIIAAWSAANKFEECASMFFDLLGETINMSKTGN